MALKYNYGQDYGMEYSRPGADSFNGRQGSQTPGAVRNQNTQPQKPSSDPYAMFRESSASWYRPPTARPPMDARALSGVLGGASQPAPSPRIDPANLTNILRGEWSPMEQARFGMYGKTFNRVDNPTDPGGGGGGGTVVTDPGGGGTSTTPPPYQPEIRPVKPGQTPVTAVPPPAKPPEKPPTTLPPTVPREQKPPIPPGTSGPPIPPSTTNPGIPPPPALPPVAPNPPAPNLTPPPNRPDPSQWNDVFMPNIPDSQEIMNLLQEMMNPSFRQAQGDLTNVLRGQAALTGDSNAGGFGNVLGREVGSLINSQQAQIADKSFQFDQAARDRALEQYNTDSQRSTDQYRIDSDKFIQQLNDDTERFGITTNAQLEQYLGDQATGLANRQIDADQLRAYYEAELQLRGIQYSADRAVDRDALNAATQRYIADINNNLGWGQLQIDQYGIDRDSQIRLIQILQQSGMNPAAIAAIINSMVPGSAYVP